MTVIVPVRWSNRDRTMFGLLPPVLLLALVLIESLHPFSVALAGWPFALSLIVIGLPHGAVDLAVSARLRGATTWLQSLRGFADYAILLVLVLAAAFAFPTPMVLAFAILSAWHFGSADALDLNESLGENRGVSWLVAVARGSLVLALPFVCHPTDSCEIANRLLQLFGSEGTTVYDTVIAPVSVGILGLAFAVILVELLVQIRVGELYYAGILCLEIGSLVAAFAVLHPLFAMGAYFLCWHSWRHTRRLIRLMEGESASIPRAVLRLHLRSLPLLIPTLAVVAAVLAWVLPHATILDVAVVALAVFVVVTPPHQMLIGRLQGIGQLGQ
jgi:beta-carotene 15,15'-dioxygenase